MSNLVNYKFPGHIVHVCANYLRVCFNFITSSNEFAHKRVEHTGKVCA